MPLTPFIGLSVFVHMGIIAWYKVFGKKDVIRRGPSKKRTTVYSRIFSVAIIAFVFIFVLVQAGMLVRASLQNQYSTIHLAEYYIHSAQTHLAVVPPVQSAPTSDKQIAYAAEPDNCSQFFSTLSSVYGNSIVNYLQIQGKDFSFDARERLAESFGISSYNGSPDENETLLVRELIALHYQDKYGCISKL